MDECLSGCPGLPPPAGPSHGRHPARSWPPPGNFIHGPQPSTRRPHLHGHHGRPGQCRKPAAFARHAGHGTRPPPGSDGPPRPRLAPPCPRHEPLGLPHTQPRHRPHQPGFPEPPVGTLQPRPRRIHGRTRRRGWLRQPHGKFHGARHHHGVAPGRRCPPTLPRQWISRRRRRRPHRRCPPGPLHPRRLGPVPVPHPQHVIGNGRNHLGPQQWLGRFHGPPRPSHRPRRQFPLGRPRPHQCRQQHRHGLGWHQPHPPRPRRCLPLGDPRPPRPGNLGQCPHPPTGSRPRLLPLRSARTSLVPRLHCPRPGLAPRSHLPRSHHGSHPGRLARQSANRHNGPRGLGHGPQFPSPGCPAPARNLLRRLRTGLGNHHGSLGEFLVLFPTPPIGSGSVRCLAHPPGNPHQDHPGELRGRSSHHDPRGGRSPRPTQLPPGFRSANPHGRRHGRYQPPPRGPGPPPARHHSQPRRPRLARRQRIGHPPHQLHR